LVGKSQKSRCLSVFYASPSATEELVTGRVCHFGVKGEKFNLNTDCPPQRPNGLAAQVTRDVGMEKKSISIPTTLGGCVYKKSKKSNTSAVQSTVTAEIVWLRQAIHFLPNSLAQLAGREGGGEQRRNMKRELKKDG
jgi:hypothetical protein